MAFIIADRVKENSTSSGLAPMTLNGAFAGFRTFISAIGAGSSTPYLIVGGSQWEVGIGTVSAGSPPTISRSLLSSSTGQLVDFDPGTKIISCVLPAARTLVKEGSVLVSLNFPSIGANSSTDLTVNVTATVGNAVLLGLPSSFTAGIIYRAFVSSPNVVTVRANNVTAGAIDPASASFQVTVVQS